jgi:hypothetical protein
MSQKKNKVVNINEKKLIKKDLETQIEAAVKSREDKIAFARESFLGQAKVAGDKYKTINGYLECRDAIVMVAGTPDLAPAQWHNEALSLASIMSQKLYDICDKFEATTGTEGLADVIDGLFDYNYIDNNPSVQWGAEQFLTARLLQNLGDVIDDLIQFADASQAAIEETKAELEKHQ